MRDFGSSTLLAEDSNCIILIGIKVFIFQRIGRCRRMRGKLGAPQAITANADKLARIIYRLLKHGEAYVRQEWRLTKRKFASNPCNACAAPPQPLVANQWNASHFR